MAEILFIQAVDVNTVLGKSVLLKLKGKGTAFRFKPTGVTVIEKANGFDQILINGYDDESLDLSIDVEDIEYIFGG